MQNRIVLQRIHLNEDMGAVSTTASSKKTGLLRVPGILLILLRWNAVEIAEGILSGKYHAGLIALVCVQGLAFYGMNRVCTGKTALQGNDGKQRHARLDVVVGILANGIERIKAEGFAVKLWKIDVLSGQTLLRREWCARHTEATDDSKEGDGINRIECRTHWPLL